MVVRPKITKKDFDIYVKVLFCWVELNYAEL